jgi:hypothetical protein
LVLRLSRIRDKQFHFARQKTLRRAADFGFILPCRFKRKPPRAAA